MITLLVFGGLYLLLSLGAGLALARWLAAVSRPPATWVVPDDVPGLQAELRDGAR